MTAAEVSPRLAALKRHLGGVKKRLLWVFVDPGVRRRVFLVFVALGLGVSLTWYYRVAVIGWLLAPAQGALSATGQPVFTGPTEMFSATMRLSMMGGLVAAAPMLAFQVARFASPIMSHRWRRFAALFLPAGAVCYLCGVAFAYFVLLPVSLGFLLQFGTDIAAPMIRITEYLDLALAMMFWLGVVFELPLAMFLAVKLGVVSHRRLRQLQRFVPIAATILSIILTPTQDWLTMLMVTVPLIVLYEVGVLLSWLARPKRA